MPACLVSVSVEKGNADMLCELNESVIKHYYFEIFSKYIINHCVRMCVCMCVSVSRPHAPTLSIDV